MRSTSVHVVMLNPEYARVHQRETARLVGRDALLRQVRRRGRRASVLRQTTGNALVIVGRWLGSGRQPLMDDVCPVEAGGVASACLAC
jgi:hypothetical protein